MQLAPMHQIKSVWGKKTEDVKVVTDRTVHENSGVCFYGGSGGGKRNLLTLLDSLKVCWDSIFASGEFRTL